VAYQRQQRGPRKYLFKSSPIGKLLHKLNVSFKEGS